MEGLTRDKYTDLHSITLLMEIISDKACLYK